MKPYICRSLFGIVRKRREKRTENLEKYGVVRT